MEVPLKTKYRTSIGSINPMGLGLGIYPEKTITQKDMCTPMFTATLFTIAKTWKQPKCPLPAEWIKMWYIFRVEYYSAIKKNKPTPFAATCTDLEIIVLSEVRERQILYVPLNTWNLIKMIQKNFCLFFFRASPVAHGNSRLGVKLEQVIFKNRSHRPMPQPQPRQIWAMYVTYSTAHSNTGPSTHSVRPGIQPASSQMLVRFVFIDQWCELPKRIYL